MKAISIREARQGFADVVEASQDETVVLTRHGQPVALIRGTEGMRMEDVLAEIADVSQRRRVFKAGRAWGKRRAR